MLLAIFDDLDASCDAVSDIIAARLEPSAMEILDRLTIEAVEDSVFAAGYPTDAAAVLLIEVEGETDASRSVLRHDVGFRTIEIRGGQLLVNGRAIRVRIKDVDFLRLSVMLELAD